MSPSSVTITDGFRCWQVDLNPQGTSIGRDPKCAIHLDSRFVSKSHARIFQGPFGRWIIEDLKSHNGVYVEDQRIQSRALLPGEHIRIATFDITLDFDKTNSTASQTTTQLDITATTTNFRDNIISRAAQPSPLLRQLNDLADSFLALPDPARLYQHTCNQLARRLHAMTAIVRTPNPPEPLPADLNLLASAFHEPLPNIRSENTKNLCLSQRVLDTVRTDSTAVMAQSTPSPDNQLVLTIVDQQNPHLVCAAPISKTEQHTDILYIDLLADNAPADIFAFTEAVARQVQFAQKSLTLAQAKAERLLLDQQLAAAQSIQSRLKPDLTQLPPHLDAALYYEPAMWVGGDYCDVWPTHDGQLAFAIGDVSGKGLPAAMLMSNLHAALRTTMAFSTDLAVVIAQVNEHLLGITAEGRFVTLFLGLFNPKTSRLAYVNAGHIPPLRLHQDAPPESFALTVDRPLGIIDSPFTMIEDKLSPDEGLIVVTDGITEQKSPAGDMYQNLRLTAAIAKPHSSAQAVIDSLITDVTSFRADLPQQDDTTVFVLLNRPAS